MKYWKYFSYVVRHKWYVFLASIKMGIPLLGILHDLSKFSLDESLPYANFFYGKKPLKRDKTGYYKPTDTGDKAFDFAWLLHQKRNKHHWQWWVLPEDNGGVKVLPMEEKYLREMVADWIGAGQAQGHFSPKDDPMLETRNWWLANNHRMQLHQETRKWIEKVLEVNK